MAHNEQAENWWQQLEPSQQQAIWTHVSRLGYRRMVIGCMLLVFLGLVCVAFFMYLDHRAMMNAYETAANRASQPIGVDAKNTEPPTLESLMTSLNALKTYTEKRPTFTFLVVWGLMWGVCIGMIGDIGLARRMSKLQFRDVPPANEAVEE